MQHRRFVKTGASERRQTLIIKHLWLRPVRVTEVDFTKTDFKNRFFVLNLGHRLSHKERLLS